MEYIELFACKSFACKKNSFHEIDSMNYFREVDSKTKENRLHRNGCDNSRHIKSILHPFVMDHTYTHGIAVQWQTVQ